LLHEADTWVAVVDAAPSLAASVAVAGTSAEVGSVGFAGKGGCHRQREQIDQSFPLQCHNQFQIQSC
jgi:hypothetical protein